MWLNEISKLEIIITYVKDILISLAYISNKNPNELQVKPSVIKYWDEKKESAIDILASIDRPYNGVTS